MMKYLQQIIKRMTQRQKLRGPLNQEVQLFFIVSIKIITGPKLVDLNLTMVKHLGQLNQM